MTGTDGTVTFDRVGLLRTPWGPLNVWQLRQYGQGWWVPVKDTSARTYGGGRYLFDTATGADPGDRDGRHADRPRVARAVRRNVSASLPVEADLGQALAVLLATGEDRVAVTDGAGSRLGTLTVAGLLAQARR